MGIGQRVARFAQERTSEAAPRSSLRNKSESAELCEVEFCADVLTGRSDASTCATGIELTGIEFEPDDGAAERGRGVAWRCAAVDGISVSVTGFKHLIALGKRKAKCLPEILGIEVPVLFARGVG